MRLAKKDKLKNSAVLHSFAQIQKQEAENGVIRKSLFFKDRYLGMEDWRKVEVLLDEVIQIYFSNENIDENDLAKVDGAMRVISDLRGEL